MGRMLGSVSARMKSDGSRTKSFTIEDPVSGDDISFIKVYEDVTISKISFNLKGSSTPSVTITLRHDPDRSATGNELVTGGTIVTSTTTGQDVDTFNDADIPIDSFLWFKITAQSGIVDEIHITYEYSQDGQ